MKDLRIGHHLRLPLSFGLRSAACLEPLLLDTPEKLALGIAILDGASSDRDKLRATIGLMEECELELPRGLLPIEPYSHAEELRLP